MVRRILVANRGEIAVRILAACRRLGIETVLAASEADLDSVPARLAGRTICLGPPPPAASYLSIGAVVAAAAATGCDAIHPGYGFLSENPGLARACAAAGLVFIGPTAAQLELAGDKLAARAQAAAAGLPGTRHGGVPRRARPRCLLLPGDERAHPGGAPGHRGDLRPGPGRRADRGCGGPAAAAGAGGCGAHRPRDREPDLRRGLS